MLANKLFSLLTFATLLSVLGGCVATPGGDNSGNPAPPVQPAVVPATSGAIYQANAGMHLFEYLKSARVGDILTVHLIEKTIASKNSNTSTSKSTDVSLTNPVIFGTPVTRSGVEIFSGSVNGEHAFDGAGSSNQSNSLMGDITVTVVERYPNGNLRIRGEKWVTLNQGKEFIRLSGIIRPYDIDPDNSVLSQKIADVQITYSSKGVLAAANRMGLFSRFFQSILSGF